MSLTFGLLRGPDVPFIEEIVKGFMTFEPEHVAKFLSEPQNAAFIAKLDGKTIGLIYGYMLTRMDEKGPQFFIYSVDIHAAYQDRGYGTRFIRHVLDWAEKNGCCESFVLTDKDNPRACRAYEKAGMTHSENDCGRTYVAEYEP